MNIHFSRKERGQSMVLVALMIIAFIALLALVLDGGLAFASRRKAQNAADAGAMAGASKLCATGNEAAAILEAENYAISNNGASAATATIPINTQIVEVAASVNYTTTFGAVLGFDSGTANATAKAGCFPVCSGEGVLPVAWSCKPPIVGIPSDSPDCGIQYGDPDAESGQPLYIVMDSTSLCSGDLLCISAGGILDCDINNDGMDDTFYDCSSASVRSWLDLDGASESNATLVAWIDGSLSPLVQIHYWLPEFGGVRDSSFTAVELRVGDIVTIPVYDRAPCAANNTETVETACPDLWDAGEDYQPFIGNDTYFHVAALAAFKITCVHGSSNDLPPCPAFEALAANLGTGDKNKMKSIEGYFIEGYNPEMYRCNTGTDPKDVGAYTVNLIP